jgi:hypothetical protein
MDLDDFLSCGSGLGDDDGGSSTVSFASGTGTVTETFTLPFGSRSVTFTLGSGSTGVYQMQGWDDHNSSVTYGFSGIGTATVTETITGSQDTTVLTYSQVSGSTSQYALSSQVATFSGTSDLTYSFTQSGGQITAVSVTDTDGSMTHTRDLPIVPDAAFTVGTSTITETFASGGKVETYTYTSNSAGGYGLTSIVTSVVPQGSATTALDVDANDRAEFTISGGQVTAASRVHADGSTNTIPASSHVAFTVLASGFVEESVTWGSHSSYTVYYAAGSNGIYTSVADGSGSPTIDLVGLKAQIAELPTAVAALL